MRTDDHSVTSLLPSALGEPDGSERRDRRVRVARAAGRERQHARGKKNVGSPGYGGPIVTAGGLVFIGATRDRRFRAFDSRTGKELWSTRFDFNVTAIPITYMGRNGKQYVAVMAATQGKATTSHCMCSRCPRHDGSALAKPRVGRHRD